ncbi:MAG TPA: RHS repeat-associated core domain-containing protein, partial [Gemmatirosa sp.]
MAERDAGARVSQPLRFQGQYADHETGLHYSRHRYYAPNEGRFVSQDPIRLAGGVNIAAYAPNPVQWIDPLGLAPCSWITPGSLPAEEEGALSQTLQHIDNGTTPTGPTATKWGTKFKNYNGDLPGASGASSPYKEYRVSPTPGTS